MATEASQRYHPFDSSHYAATHVDSNRDGLLADQPLHDPERRELRDPRKVTRNGRRASDPRSECFSAILISGRPHTSQAEFLAARPAVSRD
jgi:hypothetical protein